MHYKYCGSVYIFLHFLSGERRRYLKKNGQGYRDAVFSEMNLVFPKWSTDRSAVQKVGESEKGDISYYQVTPIKVVDFDKNHSVLLTLNAEYSDPENSVGGYQQSYYVGAYFFLKNNGKIKLVKRDDTATSFLGPTMAPETLETWAGEGYILTVTSGGCWQGACSEQITLLQVSANETKPLTQGPIPVGSNNLNETVRRFTGDIKGITCDEFLHMQPGQFNKKFKVYPRDNTETTTCGFSSSKRRFDKSHLYLEITNVHRSLKKNGRPGEMVRIVNSAAYDFSGPDGTLKLRIGENTVQGY